jgi:hypothetical protein
LDFKMNNANLPPIRVFVWTRFLFDDDSKYEGKTAGHLVSVRGRQNQALQFSVLLDNGALFTGLPAHAITFTEDLFNGVLKLQEAQMWDCISDDIEVFCMETLRYAECKVNPDIINPKLGKYLFTIDFVGEGFSRHPTHWKQLHAVETNDGYLMLYPQYRILFTDKALFERSELPKYEANSKHWIVGS